jgi:hypothetical protein
VVVGHFASMATGAGVSDLDGVAVGFQDRGSSRMPEPNMCGQLGCNGEDQGWPAYKHRWLISREPGRGYHRCQFIDGRSVGVQAHVCARARGCVSADVWCGRCCTDGQFKCGSWRSLCCIAGICCFCARSPPLPAKQCDSVERWLFAAKEQRAI